MIERLPKPLHGAAPKALRQAWELDDADKALRLLRNLTRRLDQEAPSVGASLREGPDEMLTVTRLKLAGAAAPFARLHQWNRKHAGDGASCLWQYEALAQCRHGATRGGCRHDGGTQGLSTIESL